jgi:multicomponent Na+:H+ antiporter subunit F
MENYGPMALHIAIYFAYVCLSLTLGAVMYRLIAGPGLPDRIIVLDLAASATIGFVLVVILQTGETVYLNIALVIALIAFMGTVSFARYLKKQINHE